MHQPAHFTDYPDMPLLTELVVFVGLVFYKYAAPTALPNIVAVPLWKLSRHSPDATSMRSGHRVCDIVQPGVGD